MTAQLNYGKPAKIFHWLIVALLAAQYPVGWLMPDIHGDMQPGAPMALHISIGIVILALIVARLIWRLTHPVTPDSSLPRWQQLSAEATHWLLESYYDPLDITEAIIRGHGGPCERLRLATLSFSARNVRHLRGLMDEGAVRGLTLLCSDWMADANPKVYDLARADLADQRGATLARARCHAKVAVIDLAGGARFVIEGSGNTSSCRTIEQLMCANDAGLAEWHAGWIDRLAAR